MGSKSSKSKVEKKSKSPKSEFKFLCLHGWRTSGEILFCQTAAFRHHTKIVGEFIDAPYIAEGNPDIGISTFYPDQKYYEWHTTDDFDNVEVGIQVVLKALEEDKYDGILGFSQGCRIATIVVDRLIKKNKLGSLQCVILIGGVPPLDTWLTHNNTLITPSTTSVSSSSSYINNGNSNNRKIPISSLHIVGDQDEYKSQSQLLYNLYDNQFSTWLSHSQNHRIPGMDTGIYPTVYKWLQNHIT